MSGNSYSTLASTRRQLNLLARYAEIDADVLDILKIPPVVAFTGHMVDAPGRKVPRFPPAMIERVTRAIEALLARLDCSIGYSSAACGADILFLESMQARGGETNVILPFDREDFFAASVNFAGESWIRRTAGALEKANVQQASRGSYNGEDLLFSFANRLILGKTILRSRFLETEAHLVAVWDGTRNRAVGGTAEFVETWEGTGFPYTVIDPKTAELRTYPRARREGPRSRRMARRPGRVSAAKSRQDGAAFG